MTEKARLAAAVPFKAVEGSSWQIRKIITSRTEYEGTSVLEVTDATLPGKASKLQVVVDRTENRHWWVRRKSPKALERTRVKELCKLIP